MSATKPATQYIFYTILKNMTKAPSSSGVEQAAVAPGACSSGAENLGCLFCIVRALMHRWGGVVQHRHCPSINEINCRQQALQNFTLVNFSSGDGTENCPSCGSRCPCTFGTLSYNDIVNRALAASNFLNTSVKIFFQLFISAALPMLLQQDRHCWLQVYLR